MSLIGKQMLVLVGVSLFILLLTIMIARKISSPLITTAKMLKDIVGGEGDLTRRIYLTSIDETGELAN